jgi:hypothetical protein
VAVKDRRVIEWTGVLTGGKTLTVGQVRTVRKYQSDECLHQQRWPCITEGLMGGGVIDFAVGQLTSDEAAPMLRCKDMLPDEELVRRLEQCLGQLRKPTSSRAGNLAELCRSSKLMQDLLEQIARDRASGLDALPGKKASERSREKYRKRERKNAYK